MGECIGQTLVEMEARLLAYIAFNDGKLMGQTVPDEHKNNLMGLFRAMIKANLLHECSKHKGHYLATKRGKWLATNVLGDDDA